MASEIRTDLLEAVRMFSDKDLAKERNTPN
jgi:hypothetical protein